MGIRYATAGRFEMPKPVEPWTGIRRFTNGSSIEAVAYDGENLSRFGDVVVVTLNHRLNVLGTLNLSGGPEARRVQDTVARAWVNFATTGNPSQSGLMWEPYTEAGQGAMVFDAQSRFQKLDDQVMVGLMPR